MRKHSKKVYVFLILIVIGYQIVQTKPISLFAINIDATWTIVEEDDTLHISLNSYLENLINSGSTKIYIRNGTYTLNDTIIIDDPGIIIYGESNEHTKIIQTNANSYGFKISADNVSIENLYIDNQIGKEAVYAQEVNNTTLKNCTIYGSTTNSAIAFYGTKTNDIPNYNDNKAVEEFNLDEYNQIIDNSVYSYLGSGVNDGIIFTKQAYGLVSNNKLYGSRIAFYLSRQSEVSSNTITDSATNGIRCGVPAYDNKIIYNYIEGTKTSGISIVRNDQGLTENTYRASNIVISHNTILKTRYFGIEISNLASSSIEDNVINETDFSGIYLLYSDDLSLESNVIEENSLYDNNGQLWAWNVNVNSGIFLDYQVKNCVIKENKITNYDDSFYGIKIQDGNDNTNNHVIKNIITGDFKTGIAARTELPENTELTDNTINLKVMKVPQNVKAIASGSSIIVTWDSEVDAMSYEISADNVIYNNGLNTSFEHSNLVSNSTHNYKVRFQNGDWGNVVSATVLETTIPTIQPNPSVTMPPSPTNAATPTPPVGTITAAPIPTETPISTPTNTPISTPTNTPISTPTNTPISTPTNTPIPTPTNTPIPTPTEKPIPTQNTPGAGITITPVPTAAPVLTETPLPTKSPLPTPTKIPISTPTNTPIPTPTGKPIPTTNTPGAGITEAPMPTTILVPTSVPVPTETPLLTPIIIPIIISTPNTPGAGTTVTPIPTVTPSPTEILINKPSITITPERLKPNITIIPKPIVTIYPNPINSSDLKPIVTLEPNPSNIVKPGNNEEVAKVTESPKVIDQDTKNNSKPKEVEEKEVDKKEVDKKEMSRDNYILLVIPAIFGGVFLLYFGHKKIRWHYNKKKENNDTNKRTK